VTEERDRPLVVHILAAIQRVQIFTVGGRRQFLSDEKTLGATLWNLHTLAEACRQLSPELKARHPEIDWRLLADFRNVLAHDVLGISPRRVWDIIVDHLPTLKRHVSRILPTLP
jgi:uncharacterized protein with HEPN domain